MSVYERDRQLNGEGSPKNLWKQVRDQVERFKKHIEVFDYRNKGVLDVGCGYRDFYFWMINQSAQPQS